MMRKTALVSFAIVLVLAPAAMAETAQETIRRLVRLYYVPNPTATTGEVIIDPAAYVAGTLTSDFVSSADNAPFRDLADRLWRPASTSRETAGFQTVVSEILAVRNVPIAVFLVNDHTTAPGPSGSASNGRWGINLAAGRTWPAGGAFGTQSYGTTGPQTARSAGGFFRGSFTMGNWHLLENNQFKNKPDEVAATFCHELMHTQDLIDWRTHLPGLQNLYGGTLNGHGLHQAIPNVALAYAEGIANFTAFRYGDFATTSVLSPSRVERWFVTNGNVGLETHPQYGDLYTRMQAAHVTASVTGTDGNGVEWAVYPVRSVPAAVRIHDEMIVALILHAYASHVGFHSTMQTIKAVNPGNYLVSTLPLSNLVAGLVRGATGDIRLLPIALVDYYTSYTAATPAAFRDIVEGALPGDANAEVDRYYNTVRAKILTGTPRINPAAPADSDLFNIAWRLGIRSSPAS